MSTNFTNNNEAEIAENEMAIASKDYSREFWNVAMRGRAGNERVLSKGKAKNGMFKLPFDSSKEYQTALKKESFFRNIATCVEAPRFDNEIWISDSDIDASFVQEGMPISTINVTDSFVNKKVQCNKVAVITAYKDTLIHDIGFDLKKNLTMCLARGFNRAEENAFINGTGENMPAGILHDTEGAELGTSVKEISFDSITELFLSVKPRYRKNGAWVMNDETALMLRKLKDADGNYLWNHNSDTIFGKPVYISEFKFVHDDYTYCKYYEVVYILFHTGMRISEFCGLTLKDIDLENRIVNIDHQIQRLGDMKYYIEETKTEAGKRKIPITEEVADMFRAIIEDRVAPKNEKLIDGYGGFLFYDEQGMPLVAMHWQHRFNHMVGRYNDIYRVQMPNITPHVCRHTYCSNQAKAGMNPKTLQYLMGHSDISVTMNVYTHIGFDDAEEELKKMEELRKAQAEVEKRNEKPVSQRMFKAI